MIKYGFDRLPGVASLELGGTQVAERQVEAGGVVDLIDEAGKVSGDVFKLNSPLDCPMILGQFPGANSEGTHVEI